MILPVKTIKSIDNLSMFPYKSNLEKLEKVVRFAAFAVRNQYEFANEHRIHLDKYHKFKTSMIDPTVGISGFVDFLVSNSELGTYPFMLSKDRNYATNVVDSVQYCVHPKDCTSVLYRSHGTILEPSSDVVCNIFDLEDEGAWFQYQTIFEPKLLEHLVYNSYIRHHQFMNDYSLSVNWGDADYLEIFGRHLAIKLGVRYVE